MTLHVVITGANRGIGLALVQEYLAEGATVYAVCRKASPLLQVSKAHIIEGVDVATETGLKTLKERLEGVAINVLINNAGILRADALGSCEAEALTAQFATNAMAPLLLSQALLPQIQKHGKIALVTSRMGSMADNTSGGYYGYRMSKAALNAAGKSLAIDVKPRDIAVAIIHPGYVQTDMVGNHGDIPASEAARRIVQRIKELNISNSGSFWHSSGELLPW